MGYTKLYTYFSIFLHNSYTFLHSLYIVHTYLFLVYTELYTVVIVGVYLGVLHGLIKRLYSTYLIDISNSSSGFYTNSSCEFALRIVISTISP